MTDEPEMQEPLEDPVAEPVDDVELPDDDLPYEVPADDGDDTAAILATAQLDRMGRQAYWHGTSKQLFAFLFANCLFFAGVLVAWTRTGSVPGDPPGDPSTYITGLHTIRGAFIFALALYGFWTAAFNIWHGQMKIWPYVLNAILALWVGIAGFRHSIGGEEWARAREYLDNEDIGKPIADYLTVPLSTVAPGYWLLTFGGLIVVFVIVNGLLHGSKQVKAAAAAQGGGSRRRRR
jgi:hypothetical protein